VTRRLPSRRRRAAGRCRRAAWALAPALLLFPCAAHAAALDQYTVQVLAQSGVATPGFHPIGNFFQIGGTNNGRGMNDRGQIALVTKTQESKGHEVLGVLANGQFTPIATAGGPSPDGKTWPTNVSFAPYMNEAGNVAFAAVVGNNFLGVYFWDAAKQTVIPLAVPGTPLAGDMLFANSGPAFGGAVGIALNNRDEVAFVAHVKPASGAAYDGVFLRRADGQIDPVAIAGDPLPGQAGNLKQLSDGILGVNDAGQVSFNARGTGTPDITGANGFHANSTYLWDNGTIRLVAESGTEIPGLGATQGFITLGPNNQNSDVVLMTFTRTSPGTGGFLRWHQGQLDPVLVLGQTLPGGGQFKGGFVDLVGANALGQYPIDVEFTENGQTGTGAYRIEPDGTLSLIARTGMTTPLGTLTRITPALRTGSSSSSDGIGINRQGQVALTAQIDNGPDVILLLTPKSPAP
jgi:hypothetical protein